MLQGENDDVPLELKSGLELASGSGTGFLAWRPRRLSKVNANNWLSSEIGRIIVENTIKTPYLFSGDEEGQGLVSGRARHLNVCLGLFSNLSTGLERVHLPKPIPVTPVTSLFERNVENAGHDVGPDPHFLRPF